MPSELTGLGAGRWTAGWAARSSHRFTFAHSAPRVEDVVREHGGEAVWPYLAHARLVLLWGTNPPTSGHHVWKSVQDARKAGAEQFPADTVDYADIVLPATAQHEHTDLHEGYGHLYLTWNEPAVAPPGECLPTTETFRRLARRMGLPEPALYDSDESLPEQLVASDHPWMAGVTLDRFRKEGFVRMSVPDPFLPYADGFPTPSGRFEFRSPTAGLAGYVPPAEVADEEYALDLVPAASHEFLYTQFVNNPELGRLSGGLTVRLHEDDAKARGPRLESRSPTTGTPSRPS